jgi:hypothetical protein
MKEPDLNLAHFPRVPSIAPGEEAQFREVKGEHFCSALFFDQK